MNLSRRRSVQCHEKHEAAAALNANEVATPNPTNGNTQDFHADGIFTGLAVTALPC